MSVTVIAILAVAGLIVLKKLKQPPAPNAAPAGLFAPPAPAAPANPLAAFEANSDYHMQTAIFRGIGEARAEQWCNNMADALRRVGPPKPPPTDPKS